MNVSCIDSGANSLYFSSTVVVVVVVTTVSVTTLRVSTSEMYPSFWAIERAVWPFCNAMFGYNLSPDLLMIRSRCQVLLTTGHTHSSAVSVWAWVGLGWADNTWIGHCDTTNSFYCIRLKF